MEINPSTLVEKIIEKYPQSIKVFEKYGINVIMCGQIVWDSLQDLCFKNNIDVNLLIKDIKEIIKNNC